MTIAIIGAGNVGGTLAGGWAQKGHTIHLGVPNPASEKAQYWVNQYDQIKAFTVDKAAGDAEVIVTAAVPAATREICEQLGNVEDKIIIDAMNTLGNAPDPYPNTFEALKAWTNCPDIVKCFNSTGFENMADPVYQGEGIDMFVAGNSQRGKDVAVQLALELGFGQCLDFGGDDKVALLESLAHCWIQLAIFQGLGRNHAFRFQPR